MSPCSRRMGARPPVGELPVGGLLAAALLAVGLIAPLPALPHAALIEAEAAQAIRLHAFYDTGEPMAEAQVIVFAPDTPSEPWARGTTDAEGRFVFVPGPEAGRWTVQVRQAGHGAMAHVEMGAAAPVVIAAAAAPGWVERVVTIALVAWGALGTALFAMRNRGRRDASS